MRKEVVLFSIFIVVIFLASCTKTYDNSSENLNAQPNANANSQDSPPDIITSDVDKDLDNSDISDFDVNLDPNSIG